MAKNNLKPFFRLDFSPVIRVLIISDILVLSGFGLIAPIFAVYITDTVKDGSVEVVGIAAMIFLLTRSLGQLPVGYIVDRIKGEKDDYSWLLLGSIITSFIPLLYIFTDVSWELYIVQFIYGLSQAMTYPSWFAIFTRHVDHNREGMEWGVYNTMVDLGGAAVAGLGGYIAYSFGFVPLFVVVSALSFVGAFWLITLKPYLKLKPA
jgi:MFS family permease